jgi:hypothetical protein
MLVCFSFVKTGFYGGDRGTLKTHPEVEIGNKKKRPDITEKL